MLRLKHVKLVFLIAFTLFFAAVITIIVTIVKEQQKYKQQKSDESVSAIFYSALLEALPVTQASSTSDYSRLDNLYSKYTVAYRISNITIITSVTKTPHYHADKNTKRLSAKLIHELLYQNPDHTGVSIYLSHGYWLNIERQYSILKKIRQFSVLVALLILTSALLFITTILYLYSRQISKIKINFHKLGITQSKDHIALPRSLVSTINLLNTSYQYIVELLKIRQKIATHISHDVRTPLQKISLSLDELPELKNKHIIKQQIQEICTLIDKFLTLSKGAQFNEMRSNIELNSYMDSIINEYPEDRITFIDSNEHVIVSIPKLRFKRIVDNLIQNALKHGILLRIKLITYQKYVVITFKNDYKLSEQNISPSYSGITTKSFGLGKAIINELCAQTDIDIMVQENINYYFVSLKIRYN